MASVDEMQKKLEVSLARLAALEKMARQPDQPQKDAALLKNLIRSGKAEVSLREKALEYARQQSQAHNSDKPEQTKETIPPEKYLSAVTTQLLKATFKFKDDLLNSLQTYPGRWVTAALFAVVLNTEHRIIDDLRTVCEARPDPVLISFNPITPKEKADAICDGIDNPNGYDNDP